MAENKRYASLTVSVNEDDALSLDCYLGDCEALNVDTFAPSVDLQAVVNSADEHLEDGHEVSTS